MDRQITTPIKVRLKTDLTDYHQNLTSGREGYTIGIYGQCSQLSARYIGVWFPGIRLLDVNWASLEVVSEKHLARRTKEAQEKQPPVRAVRKLIRRVGF